MLCGCPLQREEAGEGAGRAVEAAGRAGDQPQPAAARAVMSSLMLHILFSHIYSYFLFDYIFVSDVINF